jgi:murein DD-endopeptidase MepM/ murein hydrolase activator NlpD
MRAIPKKTRRTRPGRAWPADEPPGGYPLADGFDFPVSPPNGGHFVVWKGWRVDGHLGEDFDGGAANIDLGEPICAIAVGRVSFAEDVGGSWGKIVRLVHRYRDARGVPRVIESLYSHLARIDVAAGQLVHRGEQIGTLGNCNGFYQAHLHFEVRARTRLPLGPGYADDARGWLPPSEFIRQHRRLSHEP